MNSTFVSRLIGTTIVVVAAVVFIPNILDGDKVRYKEEFKAIPERPEFKSIDLQQALSDKAAQATLPADEQVQEVAADDDKLAQQSADQSDASTHTEVTESTQTVEVSAIRPDKPAERAEQSKLQQMAYVVQMGAFSKQQSVDQLVNQLKAQGYAVFTTQVKTSGGQLTKVLVGPEVDKQKLQKELAKLNKLTGLNGRITAFEVTK